MDANFILFCIFVLVILIFLTLVGILAYSGLFRSIKVGAGKPPVRKLKIAYKFGRGPYQNSGAVFSNVTSLAPKNRCVGIYYDNPKQVASENLRWAVGCVLAEGSEEPDPELLVTMRKEGYKAFVLPEVSNAVTTTFPYTTPLSCFISIFRVYPAVTRYCEENKLCAYPWMEIYDNDTIYFMGPLSKQEEFFVTETQEGPYAEEVIPSTSAAPVSHAPEWHEDAMRPEGDPKKVRPVVVSESEETRTEMSEMGMDGDGESTEVIERMEISDSAKKKFLQRSKVTVKSKVVVVKKSESKVTEMKGDGTGSTVSPPVVIKEETVTVREEGSGQSPMVKTMTTREEKTGDSPAVKFTSIQESGVSSSVDSPITFKTTETRSEVSEDTSEPSSVGTGISTTSYSTETTSYSTETTETGSSKVTTFSSDSGSDNGTETSSFEELKLEEEKK